MADWRGRVLSQPRRDHVPHDDLPDLLRLNLGAGHRLPDHGFAEADRGYTHQGPPVLAYARPARRKDDWLRHRLDFVRDVEVNNAIRVLAPA